MSKPSSVLVVVSDPETRKALHFYLTVSGFTVSTWKDSHIPPSSRQLRDTSCMVLEGRLPSLEGIDVIEGLRRDGSLVPVILLVEGLTGKLEQRAASVKACHLLQLPLLGSDLKSAIEATAGPTAAGDRPQQIRT